ncbi:MAG: hypothetical protein V1722_01650 [Candidatus Micrarchaeota archaeon]
MLKLPEYYKAARQAWKNETHARKRYPHLEIKRDSKMVLVGPKQLEKPYVALEEIVVFPRPEHIPHFRRVARSKKLQKYGPAERHPGAVGTISITNLRDNISLRFAQAHYSHKTTPRGLMTHYAGWRIRALKHAIELTQAQGVPLTVLTKFYRRKDNSSFDRDLETACKQLGVKMHRRKDGVPFVPLLK